MMQDNYTPNVISIGTIIAPELEIYSLPIDDKVIYVYDALLIRLLSEVFRVPYRVFTPQDGTIGAKLTNGNWSGIIGMVIRSEIDLAVGGIPLNEALFEAAHLSYPYIFTDTTFMTDKLRPVSSNSQLLNTFSLKLWFALIAVIFFYSFLIFFLTNTTRTYQSILLMTYGTVLGGSIQNKLRKFSHRLIIGAWLIFTFVITNSYKAVLLAFITLPNFTGIRDMPDLIQAAERNSVTCYAFNSKLIAQELFQSGFDSWKSIGKCLQQNDIKPDEAEESFVKAASGKAFMTGRIYLNPYKQKFFISEDSFFISMYVSPISRNFSCKKPYLNKMIHRLFAAGIFQKINKDEEMYLEIKSMHSDSNEPAPLEALQIRELKGAFLVLLFGYILSSIVLFIEIAVKYYFPDNNTVLKM